MPKYLLEVTYTAEGAKGVIKDGGTKRKAEAKRLIESLGGTMEAFYFAFGSRDAFVIADVPDAATMAGAALTIGATGALTNKTTVLLTPEEIDQAVKKSPSYTPPGR